MNSIYNVTAEINARPNFIYTTGNRAKAFASSQGYVDGFICRLGREEDKAEEILGKPVITLEEAARRDVNVLVVHTVWHTLYDEVCSVLDVGKIFFHNDSYVPTVESCIVCGHDGVFHGRGRFVPFLQERMFLGREQDTAMAFCPTCGTSYSSYRPSDEEIERLYDGYRNEEYVRQRQKYESSYTEEFNRSLSGGDDCSERKNGLSAFLKNNIDFGKISYVLDFGGDKGQFIPDDFSAAKRYVYDISGVETVDGVGRIQDPACLSEYHWDFIMCCHVMEHLPDVQEYFRSIVSCMEIGCYLYVEVPYERLSSMDFAWIHEHINLFGRRAFDYLAEQHGLTVIKSSVHTNIRYLMQRQSV